MKNKTVNRVKKLFEEVVELVDKYNQLQEQLRFVFVCFIFETMIFIFSFFFSCRFWNGALIDGVDQLESINQCRCAFLQEYMKKYLELLDWKRAEERV